MLDLVLDDKNDLVEPGKARVIQRILDDAVALRINGRHLLQAAEPAAHARRHHDQRRLFHGNTSLLLRYFGFLRGIRRGAGRSAASSVRTIITALFQKLNGFCKKRRIFRQIFCTLACMRGRIW